MHVAPDGLKTVRQDGITVGFAMLGPMAYILAEVPEHRLVRDVARATLRSRPLGLRHRRRDDLRLRAAPAGHPVGSCVPRARRRTDASVRDIRTSRARRIPAGRSGAGRQRRPAHRAGLRGPVGVQPADRGPGGLSRPRRARRDQGRDVADVLVRHDPGPDGRTERVHLGLVRRAALGARHARSPCHRMGARRRDPLERGHLPLPGRTAGPSHRGGGPGHVPRPHARHRVRVRGTIRRLAARTLPTTGPPRGIAVAALG